MDLSTCSKYLVFLKDECDKHLKDLSVTDDELLSLSIELERFKEKCKSSQLPENLMQKINAINFEYSKSANQKNKLFLLFAILTFGIFGYILHYQQKAKKEASLLNLKNQISGLPMYIKMNY